MNIRCLGIFRETTNSPNRENDDLLILKGVTEELSRQGAETYLVEPANLDLINPEEWDAVLPMCENYPALIKIQSWTNPPLMLNHPDSVLNCYRKKMVGIMQSSCPEMFPKTEMRGIKDIPGKLPGFLGEGGAWIKRGDVHNTCDHDVVYVKDWQDSGKVRCDFESREISDVAVQEHIEGDLVKFYGVGPFKWFAWFYHTPGHVRQYGFDCGILEKKAAAAAVAVGLEIYGGDAIIAPDGKIYVIDINSWPSFARVRNIARVHIANHVVSRVRSKVKGNSGSQRKLS